MNAHSLRVMVRRLSWSRLLSVRAAFTRNVSLGGAAPCPRLAKLLRNGEAPQEKYPRSYRGLLKLQLNWTVSRWTWYDQIPEIRGRFEDALRGEQPGSAKAEAFLRSVEHDLETYKHPDPYAFPYYEGGTKFQRNSPPPEFVLDAKMDDFR